MMRVFNTTGRTGEWLHKARLVGLTVAGSEKPQTTKQLAYLLKNQLTPHNMRVKGLRPLVRSDLVEKGYTMTENGMEVAWRVTPKWKIWERFMRDWEAKGKGYRWPAMNHPLLNNALSGQKVRYYKGQAFVVRDEFGDVVMEPKKTWNDRYMSIVESARQHVAAIHREEAVKK
eukprot:Clim_evm7s207 gene=Clim_evmTU7s207